MFTLVAFVLTLPTLSSALGFCYFQHDGSLDPNRIDPYFCTHIIVFSVSLHDGNISATDAVKTAIKAVVKLKVQNPQLKVLVSLFHENDDWRIYPSTGSGAKEAVRYVHEFLKEYNLDGLDIFYNEEDKPEKCNSIDSLLTYLRYTFRLDNYMLTICIRPDKGLCDIDDTVVDFVLVRSFLLHINSSVTGHDSALTSAHNDRNQYSDIKKVTALLQKTRGYSSAKLIIGFPLFSALQTCDDASNTDVGSASLERQITEKLPIFSQSIAVPYSDLCDTYKNSTYNWDTTHHASYINDGKNWLSFDSKRGICYKTSWLASNKVNAGYMVWTLDMDDHNEACNDGRFPVASYLKENYGKIHTDEECDYKIAGTIPIYCTANKSEEFPGYTYPRSYPNTDHTINCAKGSVTRMCIGNIAESHWGVQIDNDCITQDQIVEESRSLLDLLIPSISPVDMRRVVRNAKDLSKFAVKNEKAANLMLKICGNLMKLNTKTWKTADSGESRAAVVDILERFAAKLDIPYGMTDRSLVTENIFVAVYNVTALTQDETLTVHCKFIQENANKGVAWPTVIIPLNHEDVVQARGIRRLEVVAYRNSILFAAPEPTRLRNNYSVVSINRAGGLSYRKNGVVASYIIPQPVNDINNYACVFWDTLYKNWSTKGVILKGEGKNKACFTNHLSSFSILLVAQTDEPIPDIHEISLSYISYIGCGVSILGLLLTIVTFGLFKSLHREKSGKILLNMCVAMMLLDIAFFALDEFKTNSIEACMAEAIALHYFLLATLMWMMIEALHMYENLIVVFVESRPWFMRIRLILGWGIPLIVVGFTAVYTKDDFKESKETCFLSHINPTVFYCVVLAPSCIIILINTFVFIRVSAIILKHRATARNSSNVTNLTSVVSLTQVRGAMSVMFVLGVAWIFGPLAIGPQKLVFLYLFAIFNSIQGFLVFLFRCALNTEARLAWKYYIATGKIKKRRGSLSSTAGWTTDRSVHEKSANSSLKAKNVNTMSLRHISSGGVAPKQKCPESKRSINIASLG